MELSVQDRVTANPTAQDIARAIDATPHPEDWSIALTQNDGSFIEAVIDENGTFSVEAGTGKHLVTSAAPINAARLKAMFVKYLNGDKSWPTECRWEGDPGVAPKAVPARDPSQLPIWAMVMMAAT